jgi:hypothetical protein
MLGKIKLNASAYCFLQDVALFDFWYFPLKYIIGSEFDK